MYSNITKALNIILKEEYDTENPTASFTGLVPAGYLVTAQKK